jgi:hypothetical protein
MSTPKALVVTPKDHEPLDVLGEAISVPASVEHTGSFDVFFQEGPEGVGPPPHTHA